MSHHEDPRNQRFSGKAASAPNCWLSQLSSPPRNSGIIMTPCVLLLYDSGPLHINQTWLSQQPCGDAISVLHPRPSGLRQLDHITPPFSCQKMPISTHTDGRKPVLLVGNPGSPASLSYLIALLETYCFLNLRSLKEAHPEGRELYSEAFWFEKACPSLSTWCRAGNNRKALHAWACLRLPLQTQ